MKISKMKILTGWVVMTLVIAFTSVGFAGTLEPPESAIDSGTGEPKPTMKTLDSIPGTWDRLLDSSNGDPTTGCNSDRFTCVMNDSAVRDNETGLVWERSPAFTVHSWGDARFQCTLKSVSGRLGWRLPSIHELGTLIDKGNPGGDPDLPAGHPFINIQSSAYWSVTTDVDSSSLAFVANFDFGIAHTNPDKTSSSFVWCVRGGQNHGHVY